MPCRSASEKTMSAPSRSPDLRAATPAAIFASDEGGRLSCASVALAKRTRSKGRATRLAIFGKDTADRGRFAAKPAKAVLAKSVTPIQLPVAAKKAAAIGKR